MSTTTETKKTVKMEQVFALWKNTSKSGNEYFTGSDGKTKLVAFYNGKKKNPKEPDLRVYPLDKDGKAEEKELVSLWCNVSNSGKKFLTGKLGDKRLVGFINEKATTENKQPYVSVYFSEDAKEETKPEEPKEETVVPKSKAPF